MGNAEREKGKAGEREVAAIFAAAGCSVEQLQRNRGDTLDLLIDQELYVDSKRHEKLQVALWLREIAATAPNGGPHIVAFRSSRSPWYQAGPLQSYVDLWSGKL